MIVTQWKKSLSSSCILLDILNSCFKSIKNYFEIGGNANFRMSSTVKAETKGVWMWKGDFFQDPGKYFFVLPFLNKSFILEWLNNLPESYTNNPERIQANLFSFDSERALLLLDTEGFSSMDGSATIEKNIFILVFLLSSVIIYNTKVIN